MTERLPAVQRRRFLSACAAGAGLVTAGAIRAVEPAPAWKPTFILSSALYGDMRLADIVPEVRRTGASLIDLWPKPHGTQREEVDAVGVERVREMLVAAGVQLGGIASYRIGPFDLAAEFAVAKALGAERPVLVAMAPGDGDLTGDALVGAIGAVVAKMRPSIKAAEEAGGVIAIENHSRSLLRSPDAIRRFADAVDGARVGIALAPHHLPQEADLVAGLARELGPRLAFVYAQQAGKGATEKLPKDDELLQLPGRGPLDFGPLMRELAAMKFTGPVEIFMHPVPRGIPILDTLDAITAEVNRSRRYLEAFCG